MHKLAVSFTALQLNILWSLLPHVLAARSIRQGVESVHKLLKLRNTVVLCVCFDIIYHIHSLVVSEVSRVSKILHKPVTVLRVLRQTLCHSSLGSRDHVVDLLHFVCGSLVDFLCFLR